MNELTLLENELVPVYTTNTGEKVIWKKEKDHQAKAVQRNLKH